MPKMKTKSAAKKRFKVTGSGKVKFKPAKMRHMQMNKPKSMKRKASAKTTLADQDAKIILVNFLPYSRGKNKKRAPQARRPIAAAAE